MSFMLPAEPASARSIVGVAADVLGAISGSPGALPPVRSVVLVVIDGLGAIQLRAHTGHARRLTAGMGKKDVAFSVFPSTTASALTSMLTGVAPGQHGLVGYRVLERQGDRLVNQLSGWEEARIDAAGWQTAETVFERAALQGHPTHAVGIAAYAHSGFTRATLRGAAFHAERTPAARLARALQLADQHDGALVYCYLPEVDKAGHRHGVDSAEWVCALEEVDGAFTAPIPDGVGVLVTADHGMVDVPPHRQFVIDERGGLHDGIRHIGGEPRMLHVYLDPDAALDRVVDSWRRGLAGAADVLTRADAVAGGLFGDVVSADALSRIGDLVVPARGIWALYDGAAEDQRSRGMIGQHGSLTPEERQVPYLRLGAFAPS